MSSSPQTPQNDTAQRLGDMLLADGLITQTQLDDALAEQERLSVPLGLVLAHGGAARWQDIYTQLSVQQSLPLVDLLSTLPDADALALGEYTDYIAYRYVPLRSDEGLLHIACCDPSSELLRAHITSTFGDDWTVEYCLTSPFDMLWVMREHYGDTVSEKACDELFRKRPMRSVRYSITGRYTKPFVLLLLWSTLLIWPSSMLFGLIIALNVFYVGTLGFKCWLFALQIFAPKADENIEIESLADDELPVYSILVPLYDEAASVPRLLSSLRLLDYPKALLDIKLVVEADDAATIAAIKAEQPEAMFEMVAVPPSKPRTKPKACNYALAFARGEYVTIFDAEDEPDPQQLRRAVAIFRNPKYKDVACLQARLNYYNREENLLTRLFAIEYAALFDFMHIGLARLNMPIPLGGTSNHLVRNKLVDAGAWDPYNVTEDADLGIRLAGEGWRTLPLDSDTLEEAPISLKPWFKQRARWIKGYVQTWLVYLRRPSELYQSYGFARYVGLQTFLGGSSLVHIASPCLWLVSVLYMFGLADEWLAVPSWLVALSFAVLGGSMVMQWLMAIWVVRHRKWRRMNWAILLFPFYWSLHVVAGFMAMWELIFKPYHWNKTPHGVSQWKKT